MKTQDKMTEEDWENYERRCQALSAAASVYSQCGATPGNVINAAREFEQYLQGRWQPVVPVVEKSDIPF